MTPQRLAGICERCLDVIARREDLDRDLCLATVQQYISYIPHFEIVQTDAEIALQFYSRLAAAAGETAAVLEFLTTEGWMVVSDENQFVAAIEFLSALSHEAATIKKKRGNPTGLKHACALNALFTLEDLRIRPTLSSEGALYRLASLYYEAVTQLEDQSLERQCRAVFHWRDVEFPTFRPSNSSVTEVANRVNKRSAARGAPDMSDTWQKPHSSRRERSDATRSVPRRRTRQRRDKPRSKRS